MIKVLALEGKKKLIKNLPASRFKKFLSKRGNILWLDMNNPSKEDFDVLANVFNFHPLSIEDAKKPQELPKIDEFNTYIMVVFHGIAYDRERGVIEPKEIDMLLGRNFIVSIHRNYTKEIDEIMGNLEAKPHIMGLGPDIILHRIIDYFIDQYMPLMNYFDKQIDELEDKIIRGRSIKTQSILKQMMKLKRDILEIKQSIGPQRLVINKLSRKETPFISSRGSVYFRDVYDHVMRFYTELETYRDLIASNFEAYLSMVSNKMTEASNRMNEVMKILTVVATIFIPLTFITGLYGMNFRVMPELFWDYGYYLVLIGMLIIALVMYAFFRRKGWA